MTTSLPFTSHHLFYYMNNSIQTNTIILVTAKEIVRMLSLGRPKHIVIIVMLCYYICVLFVLFKYTSILCLDTVIIDIILQPCTGYYSGRLC